ncbi:MAG: NUDIX domain-containing protein [Candidatus Thorarchaeota archaeon]
MKYKYTTRYQGAIILNDQILLIKHSHHKDGVEYWVFPGGGREEGETEEECVQREIKEETNLDVVVERLLLETAGQPNTTYRLYKTYLCKPLTTQAQPGYEPEPEASEVYEISEVGWFDLRSEEYWPTDQVFKRFFYPQLKKIQKLFFYD